MCGKRRLSFTRECFHYIGDPFQLLVLCGCGRMGGGRQTCAVRRDELVNGYSFVVGTTREWTRYDFLVSEN